MKNLLRIGLGLMCSVAVLTARPTSSSRSSGSSGSSGSHSSYGSSRTYSSPSHSSSSSGSGSSSSHVSGGSSSSKAWGSSTTFTSQSSKNWGSSTTSTPVARTPAETTLNRAINQTSSTAGGVSRAAATQERATAMAPRPAAAGPVPAGYNASTDYYTARTYVHYYDVQPSIWPIGIPTFYMYRGYRYSVMWDPFYHSYGWYMPDRSWVYYDSMLPAAAAIAPIAPAVVVHTRQSFFGGLFGVIFFLVFIALILAIIWYLVTRPRRTAVAYDAPATPGPQERPSYKAPVATRDDLGRLTQGSVIRLTDASSMEDAIKLAPSSTGLFVTVNHVLTVREKNDLCQWTLINATSEWENQELLIKVKQVGAQRDVVCYTRDIEGSRPDLLAQNHFFLFGQPADENNFDPMELRYAKQFARELDGKQEDTFALIHPHELHGSAVYRPPQAGVTEVLATIAEWRNVARETNEYIAIETGNGASSNVETWWGDRVAANEIEFFPEVATGRKG